MTRLGHGLDRRTVLSGIAYSSAGAAATWALFGTGLAQQVYKEVHELKPGEFTWHPEVSPAGPVAVVVSLPDQRVFVYRNGVRIAVSTCSTGKPGHRTPTGVFTVLQKDKHHHSSTYNNAPMPNMNRLTWSGVALHAGNLPGYPASHGCIRLPYKFSELLFGVTHVGTPVIVADGHSDPKEVVHPGLVLSRYAEHEFDEAVAKLNNKKLPAQTHEDNPTPPTSVVVSRADQSAIILENGDIVLDGRAYFKNPDQPVGNHVFILSSGHDGRKGLAWHAVGHHPSDGKAVVQPEENVILRLSAEPKVIEAVKARMHPGMVMVLTDLPAHPDTRSGRDFVVMNAAPA